MLSQVANTFQKITATEGIDTSCTVIPHAVEHVRYHSRFEGQNDKDRRDGGSHAWLTPKLKDQEAISC